MNFNKKRPKDGSLELFFFRNMTLVVLVIFLIIWAIFIYGHIDLTYTLTSSGAIIGFGYGYRKYERDEEIKLMEMYSVKYKDTLELKGDTAYLRIIDLWYEEFFLYSRGYISKNLWVEWEHWIYEDFGDMIEFITDQYNKSRKKENFFLENAICNKLLDFALYGASDINHYVNIKNGGIKKYIRRFKDNITDPANKSGYYSYSKVGGLNFFDYIVQLITEQIHHTEHLIYVGKIMKKNDRKKYLSLKEEFDESYKELEFRLKTERELLDYLT